MNFSSFTIICILIISSLTLTSLKSEKCSQVCFCKRVHDGSSKVQVARCSINSSETLLQCNVEWPVLYLTVAVPQFKANHLQRCQRIKRLQILSDSLLTVLGSDMFLYGTNIEILVIKAPIKTLESVLLRHMTSLQELDISETKVDIITRSVFDECPLTKSLRLASNKIELIEDGSFKNCINITMLDLSGNLLGKIYRLTFKGVLNLNRLDLSSNQLSSIDGHSFDNLKNLKILHLKDNLLTSIKRDTFRGLESLTFLRLERNKIFYIALEAFENLKSIQRINLKDNKIYRLDMNLFLHLPQLKVVFLDVDCVQSREEDSHNVSFDVLTEFNKYPLCDGLQRIKVGNDKHQESQLLFQVTSVNRISTNKLQEDHSLTETFEKPSYLVSMILGCLTIILVSTIVISLVCHVKNKKIHELQLQEIELPVHQTFM